MVFGPSACLLNLFWLLLTDVIGPRWMIQDDAAELQFLSNTHLRRASRTSHRALSFSGVLLN